MPQVEFKQKLTNAERRLWQSLDSPRKIQEYLDHTPYSTDDFNRCPLRVLRDRTANCFDGAVLAAGALQNLGHPPLILDLIPEPGTDDDHLLTIYKTNGLYGCVAKSNFACLRSREPVYRSLRELVMSYFDWFYNVEKQKTLRGYNRPLNLTTFDRLNWMWEDKGMDIIEKSLYRLKTIQIIPSSTAHALEPMDDLTYQAGMMGVNPAGLFKPKE